MSLTLQHTPAQIIAKLLADLGLGTTPSVNSVGEWPIYVSDLPNVPDNLISVTDTQGRNSGRVHVTGEVIDFEGIQVLVRNRRYDNCFLKIKAIADAFDLTVHRTDVTISSTTYKIQSIQRTGNILPFGKAASIKGRMTSDHNMFTINALVCLVEG